MPPDASSSAPARARSAPVKAPFSCPNSSLSTSPGASAPQSTTTNGRSARGEARCSAAASTSLPVPLSPSISTVESDGAACSTSAKSARIAGASPTRPPNGVARQQVLDLVVGQLPLELALAELQAPRALVEQRLAHAHARG